MSRRKSSEELQLSGTYRPDRHALRRRPSAAPRPIEAEDIPPGHLEGMCGEPQPPNGSPFWEFDMHPDVWRSHWRRYGAAALAHWTKKRPGTRPESWWLYVAPEQRRVLKSGKPEAEVTYLRRHKLLLPAEERRLRR